MFFPVEIRSGNAKLSIPLCGVTYTACNISGVSGYLCGYNTGSDILSGRQTEMLARRDITNKRRTVKCRGSRPYCRGYVVIADPDIRHQRAENIERSPFADFLLKLHIILYLVKRNVAG